MLTVRRAEMLALALLAAFTLVPLLAMGPWDASDDKLHVRQVVIGVAGNAFLVSIVLLAFRRAGQARDRTDRTALMFVGIGLAGTTSGGLFWTYYYFSGTTNAPYPGPADVSYLLAVTFLVAAFALWLSRMKRRLEGFEIALVAGVPLIVGVGMYTFFLADRIASGGAGASQVLAVVFGAGDAAYVTLAVLVLSLQRNGPQRSAMRLLASGLMMLAVADTVFSFAIANGAYFTGSWVDLLYWTADILLAAGIWSFASRAAPTEAPARVALAAES